MIIFVYIAKGTVCVLPGMFPATIIVAPNSEKALIKPSNIPAVIPLYDNGNAIFSYDTNPTRDGTMSPEGGWRWDGQNAMWVVQTMMPPS